MSSEHLTEDLKMNLADAYWAEEAIKDTEEPPAVSTVLRQLKGTVDVKTRMWKTMKAAR